MKILGVVAILAGVSSLVLGLMALAGNTVSVGLHGRSEPGAQIFLLSAAFVLIIGGLIVLIIA